MVYVYEYEGEEYKTSRICGYPDVIPIDNEIKVLIDPDEPASSTYIDDRYRDVLNAGTLAGLLLEAGAAAIGGLLLHACRRDRY